MRRTVLNSAVGISGMAVFAPPAKVDLEQWCNWTGNEWPKVRAVVGSSFRVPARCENAYTMAANAVLRLIEQNDVDPQAIGYLGLGTESSTDNSAGAVIVRGMVDKALRETGRPALSRHCEVPEFKHACLGGIYAVKGACRYAAADGAGRQAIVVASDIAEYQRGSSGEQTQGAGAVAMLVEQDPRLCELDLAVAGSASAYRGPDFRKPFKRHFMEGYAKPNEEASGNKIADFPVFSGPYSTTAYLDQVTMAVERMLANSGSAPGEYYDKTAALFFHRPYHMMPVQAMSFLYARALARATSDARRQEFEALCSGAKVSPAAVRAELDEEPDLFAAIEATGAPPKGVFAATNALARAVRSDERFTELLATKMSLGSRTMASLGNLYTAALPAWLAAGFEEAVTSGIDIAKKPMVIVGYGSGDAAEAIPMRPVAGWEAAASRIRLAEALSGAVELSHEQYKLMHAGDLDSDIARAHRSAEFVVGRIGHRNEAAFQDIGIEYYDFIAAAAKDTAKATSV